MSSEFIIEFYEPNGIFFCDSLHLKNHSLVRLGNGTFLSERRRETNREICIHNNKTDP